VELVLRTNPNLVPGEVRVSSPVRRVLALIEETSDVKLSDGDLFHWMHRTIVPLTPEQDRVVTQVHFTTDGSSTQAAAAPNYRYPITVTINDTDLEMAFFSSYIAWLSLSDEVIASSQNYRLVREAILEVRELSEAAQARFLLVYVPTKAHVYLPYMNDAETLTRVFTDVPTLELNQAGFLQFTNQTATVELTRQHLDDQARLLGEFAENENINYLDLTPNFQEEAATGVELYYPFDTHWNQRGHTLAAQTIGRYIENILTVTANEKPCSS
jgi:hypothetical protein